ncbi:MAG: hypothetical protein JW724_00730 [Candidatus Altiarchaeota archaeon]|nr:hypothetical protein [Candidatus Altiarchaeota archaeon]
MTKQKILGLSALGVLSVLICGGLVTAYLAEDSMGKRGKGLMMRADLEGLDLPEDATREQVREAVRAKEMEELGLSEDATDEEIRAAMQQRMEERRAETEENRAAMQQKMEEQKAKLDAAVQAGDYESWKTLVLETPRGETLTEVITEENFQKYAEMQDHLQKAGAMAEELGFPGIGKGMRGGFGKMRCGCPSDEQSE